MGVTKNITEITDVMGVMKNITNITDSGSGYDYEFVNDYGGGSSDANDQPESSMEKPPPPLSFSQIKNNITQNGYFLNEDDDVLLAQFIAKTDPSWFHGHSFIDFIAEIVRGEYADKPKREQRRIFRKLLFDAANLCDEYPEWRASQERRAQIAEQEAALERAKANIPKKCRCGSALNSSLGCQKCGGHYQFDVKKTAYVFFPLEKKGLKDGFKKIINQRGDTR
jgi:hypothetical protein